MDGFGNRLLDWRANRTIGVSLRQAGREPLVPLVVSIVVIATLFFAKEVLVPFALALLFAFALSPVVAWLERKHIGRIPAVILVLTVSFSVLAFTGWVVGNQLIAIVNQLPSYRANIHNKVKLLHSPTTGSLGRASEAVKEINNELTSQKSLPVDKSRDIPSSSANSTRPIPVAVVPSSGALDEVSALLGPVLAPIGTTLIVVVFTIFMLLKKEDIRNRLLRVAGQGQPTL